MESEAAGSVAEVDAEAEVESVVLDLDTELNEESSETETKNKAAYHAKIERLLSEFKWNDYAKYVPEDLHPNLSEYITEQKYGWKIRAKVLIKLAFHSDMAERLIESLREMASPEKRVRRPSHIDPRTALRIYITSLPEGGLKALARAKEVSYNSYMNANDREGMIDTILDYMVSEYTD